MPELNAKDLREVLKQYKDDAQIVVQIIIRDDVRWYTIVGDVTFDPPVPDHCVLALGECVMC